MIMIHVEVMRMYNISLMSSQAWRTRNTNDRGSENDRRIVKCNIESILRLVSYLCFLCHWPIESSRLMLMLYSLCQASIGPLPRIRDKSLVNAPYNSFVSLIE